MEFIKFTDVEKVYKTGVTAIYGLNLRIKKVFISSNDNNKAN